jgi:hypothetical protein
MIGNGLGPAWFPKPIRRALTSLGKLFFQEASWEIHDESYATGSPSRWRADRGFLAAMLRDASRDQSILKMLACTIIAWALWLLVRAGGWMSYRKKPTAPVANVTRKEGKMHG